MSNQITGAYESCNYFFETQLAPWLIHSFGFPSVSGTTLKCLQTRDFVFGLCSSGRDEVAIFSR